MDKVEPQVEGIPEPDIMSTFVYSLEQLGLAVTQVSTYATRRLPASLYRVELQLLKEGKIDAIAISSTAEISALLQMIGAEILMQNCLIACFGLYTARNAEYLGLSVDIASKDFSSFTGFVEMTANFFHP